jgi:hypothetical protein
MEYVPSFPVSVLRRNREACELCNKTVGEHPMVLFIIIVETFVHVQHKSSEPAGLLERAILRGVYRILHKGRTCRIPRRKVVLFIRLGSLDDSEV